MDRYVLDWCSIGAPPPPGGGSSHHHNPLVKMGRDARWPVYLPDSARGGGKGSRGEPLGFLEAADLAGRVSMVLLPYNYPRLAELVRQAVEAMKGGANLTGLPVKWRPEFNAYLSQTPPYYYPSLCRSLKRVGLHTQVPEAKGGGLSQTVLKRLQRLRDAAREENQRYEQSRSKHPRHNPELQQQLQQQLYTGVPDASAAVGVTGLPPQAPGGGGLGLGTADLLAQWEATRRKLFGQHGHTLSGLYVKGLKSWRGACGGRQARRPGMTLLGQVGAQQVPENPIVEMGAYTETLLRAEMLRDPLAEPDPEEDTPEGLLQRKLQVNFGNPFRNIHHGHTPLPPGAAGAGGVGVGAAAGAGGGAGGGPGGVGGGGSPAAGPHVLSAEAEDEAAVLGPHSALGDDLGGEGEGASTSARVAAASAGADAGRNGSAEAGAGDGSTLDEQGQPARKRQRLNELPPLPTAKKFKRQHDHSHKQQQQQQRVAVPSSNSSSSGGGGSSTGERSKSPPVAAPTPSSPSRAVEGATPSAKGKGKGKGKEQTQAAGAAAEAAAPSVVAQAAAADQKEEGAAAAAPQSKPSPREGGERATTPEAALPSSSSKPTRKPKPAAAAASSAAGAGATTQTDSRPARPTASAGASRAQAQQQQPPQQPQQQLPVRPIEELLKDPALQTPNEDGWMLAFSKREKRPYYFNTKTNISVWQAPPGLPPINVDTPAVAMGGGGGGGGETPPSKG